MVWTSKNCPKSPVSSEELPRSYPESAEARRKERVAMAREICLHRGENPNTIDRGGNEGWEKYEPLAGACIREAERLFARRTGGVAQAPTNHVDPEASVPTYGNIPWDQLGRDVMEATCGSRADYAYDPKFYPGHQIAGINFNSLARIVDKYRLPALPSTDRVNLPGHDETMANLDALTISSKPRCTCAAIVNPNIPHARSCPLSDHKS